MDGNGMEWHEMDARFQVVIPDDYSSCSLPTTGHSPDLPDEELWTAQLAGSDCWLS